MAVYSALVCLIILFVSSTQAQNAGLIVIPSTVTPELGAYYINKLGSGFAYYRLLTQRNNAGTNAYALVNNISADADPISAARTISPLRGFYSKGGIGGKVTVEIFYKLLRCADDNCAIMDRILVTGVAPNRPGPADALSVVRAGIGSSFWLLNANQATANALLAAAEERSYMDKTYDTQLYYKVNVQPRACSPVVPLTAWASIGEFTKNSQFGCLNNQGNTFLFATNRPSGVEIMTESIVPPDRCDGSLAVVYGTIGPVIVKQVLELGAVARTVKITLAGISALCRSLYDTPQRLFALTSLVAQTTFYEATLADDVATVTAAGEALGFNGTCAFQAFEYLYGPLVIGQSNALRDSTNNQTFLDLLLPYNDNQPCFALTGNSFSTSSRDPGEDACAAIFYGDATQTSSLRCRSTSRRPRITSSAAPRSSCTWIPSPPTRPPSSPSRSRSRQRASSLRARLAGWGSTAAAKSPPPLRARSRS
ncbi:hypothetical protein KFL_011100010 [Klebsormidium nitens]|uniref:Uncharacterized protein n=1 Tax=Klebsormidium nitens TaxID=105231 RepID=A0A1Y1IPB1_KLENI|nr:hypothetical protein KFL_011100010 [Klebsormidium nitens]|eukprot:GAQ92725.1 hypothetical protein KFL_011100010 [Klebsormidium nitens]